MRNLFCYISLRRLREQKGRSFLTTFGTALGVAMFVAVAVVNRSVLASFRGGVEAISGRATLQVSIVGRGSGIPTQRIAEVRRVPGVRRATAVIQANVVTRGCSGEALVVVGVEPSIDAEMRDYALAEAGVEVRNPLELLRSDALLLGKAFARRHGLTTGSTIELLTKGGVRRFRVVGTLDPKGPAAAFGGNVAVMMLSSAQVAFGRPGHADWFDVETDPAESVDVVAAAIRATMGEGIVVARPESRGEHVERMLESFQSGLSIASVVALFVGMFLIYNAMTIAVLQRRQEIGTLRAVGATRAQILAVFSSEAAAMGLVGGAIGVPLGILLARGALGTVAEVITSVYVLTSATEVHVPRGVLPLGVLVGVLVSTASGFIPSWHATRVPPVDAMRRSTGEIGSRRRYFWYHLVGVLSMPSAWWLTEFKPLPKTNWNGFSAIFVLLGGFSMFSPGATVLMARGMRLLFGDVLGVEARLARDHLVQSLGRSSVTVSALMVGVAAIVTSAIYLESFKVSVLSWIRGSITADLFVASGAPLPGPLSMPLEPEIVGGVSRIPGVVHAMPIRLTRVDLRGRMVTFTVLDMRWYAQRARLQVREGEEREILRRMADPGDWVVVSENVSRKFDLHVGQKFEMETPAGVARFEVGGVVVDFTSDLGVILIDWTTYQRYWRDDTVDLVDLYLDPSVDPESVRRAILSKYGDSHVLFVSSKAELSARALDIIDQSFVVTYALEIVALLVAILGVMNTLLATTLDRTREIGVLRAIGGTRGQVRKIFMMEAAYLGAAACLLGIATGFALAWLSVTVVNEENTGWTTGFHVPYALTGMTALGILAVSVVAGAYPGRMAGRIHLVKALEYE